MRLTGAAVRYIRNRTKTEQWLVDPNSGVRRRVEADGLVQVTEEVALRALEAEPSIWERVDPIPLGPPPLTTR